jgi:hypothetical protein
MYDPADERSNVAIDTTMNCTSWVRRIIQPSMLFQKYVAPWKFFHLDQLILSEYVDRTKMQAPNEVLVDLPSGDGLPETLRAWWNNILDPDLQHRSEKLAAELARPIKRTRCKLCRDSEDQKIFNYLMA